MTRNLGAASSSLLLFAGTSVAALATLTWSPVAEACSCAPPPAPALAMADSKAVFEGKLVSQVNALRRLVADDGAQSGPELTVNVATFEVLRVWKGADLQVGSTVTIETAGDSAACGRDYSSASEWIVYAYEQDGRLADGLCTRSGPSDAAAADGDATALDAAAQGTDAPETPSAGGAPEETEASKASREGCAVDDENPSGLAAVLACLALVSRRRRPRA